MPYLHRDSGPQAHPTPKDARITHSLGQSFEQLRQGCLSRGTLFEDPDFPASNSSLFYSERPPVPFVWKRPGVSGDEQGWAAGPLQLRGQRAPGMGGAAILASACSSRENRAGRKQKTGNAVWY